jgi:hypothetical protein
MTDDELQLLREGVRCLQSIEALLLAVVGTEPAPATPAQAAPAKAKQDDERPWHCNACNRQLDGDERCAPCFDQRIGRYRK